MSKPPRAPWSPGFPAFPDVALHAEETSVRRSVGYLEAKSGDADAAIELVMRFLSPVAIELVNGFAQQREPIIVSVHAVEQQSVNAIPEAMANELGRRLDWPVEHDIVQVNVVGHTRADGYRRLANQAAFSGAVTAGSDYHRGSRRSSCWCHHFDGEACFDDTGAQARPTHLTAIEAWQRTRRLVARQIRSRLRLPH